MIEEICDRCKNVRVLRLSGCYSLTDQSLSLISRHLIELVDLSLSGGNFSSLTPNAMTSSICRLHRLTSLEFVRLLFNKFKVFRLDFNVAVTSELIRSISSNLNDLTCLSLAFAGSGEYFESIFI